MVTKDIQQHIKAMLVNIAQEETDNVVQDAVEAVLKNVKERAEHDIQEFLASLKMHVEVDLKDNCTIIKIKIPNYKDV